MSVEAGAVKTECVSIDYELVLQTEPGAARVKQEYEPDEPTVQHSVFTDTGSNGSAAVSEHEFKYEVPSEPPCLTPPVIHDETPVKDGGSEDEFKYEVALEPGCLVVPVDTLAAFQNHNASEAAEEQDTLSGSPLDNTRATHAHTRTPARHAARRPAPAPAPAPAHAPASAPAPTPAPVPAPAPAPHIPDQPLILNYMLARLYTCEICGKAFDNYGRFKKHIINHVRKKPFTCEVCSKQFSLKLSLTNHKRTLDMDISCEVCHKLFATNSHLQKHQVTHVGEKTFSCKLCDKTCQTMTSLIIHEITHTGEKV